MKRSEILVFCAKHGGDIQKAAIAYAKMHGLPAKSVLIGWKNLLSNKPTTSAKGAKE